MGRRRTWVLNCVGVPHELARDIVMIGRVPSNHIVIDDPTVSAQHAVLLRVGDSYWLKDLNSTNGTHINGVLVTDAMLRDSDTIQLGSVVVAFAGCCRKERSSHGTKRFGEYFGVSSMQTLAFVVAARFGDFLKSRKSATTARARN
jgi:pSer/pThr/pTyr-binding forkhead associated (FHA) protein